MNKSVAARCPSLPGRTCISLILSRSTSPRSTPNSLHTTTSAGTLIIIDEPSCAAYTIMPDSSNAVPFFRESMCVQEYHTDTNLPFSGSYAEIATYFAVALGSRCSEFSIATTLPSDLMYSAVSWQNPISDGLGGQGTENSNAEGSRGSGTPLWHSGIDIRDMPAVWLALRKLLCTNVRMHRRPPNPVIPILESWLGRETPRDEILSAYRRRAKPRPAGYPFVSIQTHAGYTATLDMTRSCPAADRIIFIGTETLAASDLFPSLLTPSEYRGTQRHLRKVRYCIECVSSHIIFLSHQATTRDLIKGYSRVNPDFQVLLLLVAVWLLFIQSSDDWYKLERCNGHGLRSHCSKACEKLRAAHCMFCFQLS